MKKFFLIYVMFVWAGNVTAQRSNMSSVDYNRDVVNPIMEDDVMFRKYVMRRINFKEKQNKGFANEYSSFPIELLRALENPNSGIIRYSPISVVENGEFKKDDIASFSSEVIDFVRNKAKEQVQPGEQYLDENGNIIQGITIPYHDDWGNGKLADDARKYLKTLGCVETGVDPNGQSYEQVKISGEQDAVNASLHMIEEVVFDKRRSRMYINIIAFQLVYPPCGPGLPPRPGPYIKYQQVDKYFRKLYYESKETKGMWFNERNVRRKMCVMDAFELRLFSSRIIKISNAEDKKLEEIYTNKMEELYKSQEAEMELMEFEHNLWEF